MLTIGGQSKNAQTRGVSDQVALGDATFPDASSYLLTIEVEHLDGVSAQDLVGHVIVETRAQLLDVRL